MATTFKVGDKVEHRTFGAGEIAFGPFEHFSGSARYLMKNPRGVHHVVEDEAMTPAAKFKVGDKVKQHGANLTIHAGPFYGGSEWYAVEDARGKVLQASADSMTAVAPEPARDTVESAGKTYELGVFYRDNDGDRWKFQRGILGAVSTADSFEGGRPLRSVVSNYGPLTKI